MAAPTIHGSVGLILKRSTGERVCEPIEYTFLELLQVPLQTDVDVVVVTAADQSVSQSVSKSVSQPFISGFLNWLACRPDERRRMDSSAQFWEAAPSIRSTSPSVTETGHTRAQPTRWQRRCCCVTGPACHDRSQIGGDLIRTK